MIDVKEEIQRITKEFPSRFLALLGDKSLDVFCKETAISKSQITHWLKKPHFPKVKYILIICNYFHCKPSYFYGI